MNATGANGEAVFRPSVLRAKRIAIERGGTELPPASSSMSMPLSRRFFGGTAPSPLANEESGPSQPSDDGEDSSGLIREIRRGSLQFSNDSALDGIEEQEPGVEEFGAGVPPTVTRNGVDRSWPVAAHRYA